LGIAEFLHEHPAKPKTLFATHYHELNEMSEPPEPETMYSAVKELKDTVLFVRKLVKGGSAHSFGIHVAKWQECPNVILKAQKLLKKLEKDHSSDA
jgi:DNA mismatch repair protein MutS